MKPEKAQLTERHSPQEESVENILHNTIGPLSVVITSGISMDEEKLNQDSKLYGTFRILEEDDDLPYQGFNIPPEANSTNSSQFENIPRVVINRTVFNQNALDELIPRHPRIQQPLPSQICDIVKSRCGCSAKCLGYFLRNLFAITKWLPHYSIQECLLADIVTGITISIMHVPQGMAYALLASVPPIYGLYTSFYPPLMYFLMGTSRHVSVGTFAITSLLTSIAIKSVRDGLSVEYQAPVHTQSAINGSWTTEQNATTVVVSGELDILYPYTAIQVAMLVTFTSGLLQAILGIFRLGFLTVFMSDEMVSGFVTGSAVHVLTSQMKPFTGIKFSSYSGPFNIILSWLALFANITSANYIVVLISLISILLLVAIKDFINIPFKDKFKIPLPAELLLVITGTITSHYLKLHHLYDVDVVGDIPTGLQAPESPPFELLPQVLTSSIILSLVSTVSSLSIVIIYAKKHRLEVDMNQELLAFGVANIFSSFFFCFPSSVSLSRSAIQEATGAKSQMTSLVSCGLVLIVLLILGPFFEALPNCVLSAIIVVAIKSLLMQIGELRELWKTSKLDTLTWLATFFAVVVLDVDYGLIIGIVFSLITVLYRSQVPKTSILGHIPGTEFYRDIAKYPTARLIPGIRICHFGASLYFANKEFFRSEIYRLAGVHPQELSRHTSTPALGDGAKFSLLEEDDLKKSISQPSLWDDSHVYCVILSSSAIGYVDTAGAKAILEVVKEYADAGIVVYLAGLTDSLLERLERLEFFEHIPRDHIFPSVHDAVVFAVAGSLDSQNL
ncbi:prestin-like isoform X2 [Tachypleus tridentatus]|uniref:prestin-like isoform X2 n=1 Tax=Tachypleus tridentatus TaxID=6853 RepID=UPI003FD22D2B